MGMTRRKKRNFASVVVLLLGLVAIVAWSCLWREMPQPGWITVDQRSDFLYGSVGGERDAGIPYWIWLALPRMFPEYMPGNGGYLSVGFSWEEGREMPAGFSKKDGRLHSRSGKLCPLPRCFLPRRAGRRL